MTTLPNSHEILQRASRVRGEDEAFRVLVDARWCDTWSGAYDTDDLSCEEEVYLRLPILTPHLVRMAALAGQMRALVGNESFGAAEGLLIAECVVEGLERSVDSSNQDLWGHAKLVALASARGWIALDPAFRERLRKLLPPLIQLRQRDAGGVVDEAAEAIRQVARAVLSDPAADEDILLSVLEHADAHLVSEEAFGFAQHANAGLRVFRALARRVKTGGEEMAWALAQLPEVRTDAELRGRLEAACGPNDFQMKQYLCLDAGEDTRRRFRELATEAPHLAGELIANLDFEVHRLEQEDLVPLFSSKISAVRLAAIAAHAYLEPNAPMREAEEARRERRRTARQRAEHPDLLPF
jgi:hypothetical protein